MQNSTNSNVNSELNQNTNNVIMNYNINNSKKFIEIKVIINGKTFGALVDSGAELTRMRKSVADDLNLSLNQYTGPNIETCDKTTIKTFGQTDIQMSIRNERLYSINISILIVERLPAHILI